MYRATCCAAAQRIDNILRVRMTRTNAAAGAVAGGAALLPAAGRVLSPPRLPRRRAGSYVLEEYILYYIY